MCVETHLGGEGKRSHVDTHTLTLHAQIQMGHSSSPPVGGVAVGLVCQYLRSPVTHAQTQMKHNSSPQVGDVEAELASGSPTVYCHQWRSPPSG